MNPINKDAINFRVFPWIFLEPGLILVEHMYKFWTTFLLQFWRHSEKPDPI